jgi:hypothetical protein
MLNAFKIVVTKCEGNKREKFRLKSKDNIKIDVKYLECDRIQVTEVRVVMDTVLNIAAEHCSS